MWTLDLSSSPPPPSPSQQQRLLPAAVAAGVARAGAGERLSTIFGNEIVGRRRRGEVGRAGGGEEGESGRMGGILHIFHS